MNKYIKTNLVAELEVNNINDISVNIFETDHEDGYCLDINDSIICDKDGNKYILTLCSIDPGGGPGGCDCIDENSFIFTVNEKQAEILKTLTGQIGTFIDLFANPNYKDREVYDKLVNVLDLLGLDVQNTLSKMNIDRDTFCLDTYGFLNKII